MFWSEIGSGFGELGGTPPPRIPRSTPPPPPGGGGIELNMISLGSTDWHYANVISCDLLVSCRLSVTVFVSVIIRLYGIGAHSTVATVREVTAVVDGASFDRELGPFISVKFCLQGPCKFVEPMVVKQIPCFPANHGQVSWIISF